VRLVRALLEELEAPLPATMSPRVLRAEIAVDLAAANDYVARHGSFAEMACEHYAATDDDTVWGLRESSCPRATELPVCRDAAGRCSARRPWAGCGAGCATSGVSGHQWPAYPARDDIFAAIDYLFFGV